MSSTISLPPIAIPLLLAVLSAGCAGQDAGPGGRGQLGKADLVGACTVKSCGGQALEGSCWCDDSCESFGDCCENYSSLCVGLVTCVDSDDCPEDQYCAFLPSEVCGFIELPGGVLGSCQTPPGACPEIFGPVCGCDSVTYPNDCFAAMAGTNVFSDGPCEVGPDSCEPESALHSECD